jgi:ketosteroid isomerase-like protein
MSQENVDVVQRAWDAWLRGDLPGLLRHFTPDIVWDTSHYRDWPEPAYHGREGVERFLSEWLAVWDDYEVGVDESLAAPDGRVVSLYWHRGKGRASGLAMHDEIAYVATVRDRKIAYIEIYDDRAAALAAAGLVVGS